MLVGSYPFEDPEDPRNFRKTISRILNVQYSIPDYVRVSSDCRQLLSQIFVASPSRRITIPEIKKNPWFLKNLPKEIAEGEKTNYNGTENSQSTQSVEEIMRIIQEAKKPADSSKEADQSASGLTDPEDAEADAESDAELCDSRMVDVAVAVASKLWARVAPDADTYALLIAGSCRRGDFAGAAKLWNAAAAAGIEPGADAHDAMRKMDLWMEF